MNSIIRRRFFFPIILVVALGVYHLLTLSISPLPWLDEVMFASLTHSVLTTGHYYFTLLPYHLNNQEALFYGPVYFNITAFCERVLGIGIFQFRLVSCLSGFALLFVAASTYSRFVKLPSAYFMLFLLLLAFDPGIMASMHGGRMDLLAVTFMLASTYFILVFKDTDHQSSSFIWLSLSGVFAALGILTTPRSGLLIIPIAGLLLIRFYQIKNKRAFSEMLLWGVLILIPSLLWIAHAFSTSGRLGQNIHAAGTAGNWFGGNLLGFHHLKNYLPAQAVLMLVCFAGMLLWYFNSNKKSKSILSVLCIVNFFLFYALVFEVGTYYILIAPFCYLFLFVAIEEVSSSVSVYSRWLVITLLLFNLSFFSVKSVRLYQFREDRNPEKIQAYIGNLIPPNALVLGEAPFYYAATTNNLEFELVLPPRDMLDQAADRFEKKGLPIYQVVSQGRFDSNKQLFDSLEATGKIEKIGAFINGRGNDKNSFSKLRTLSESYNCIVFRYNGTKASHTQS